MLLRPIRYLKAVADHGSFTRAASALHVSQQIREFEERMGVQMLDRSGRQVRPTDAGEVYLRRSHPIHTLRKNGETRAAPNRQCLGMF